MGLTRKLILFPALLFITSYGCSQDVHYNYDRSANFALYKTYQWVDIPSGAPNFLNGGTDIRDGVSEDQLVDHEIKRAIDEQLALKGLTKVENNADLKVSYQAAIHQEIV